MYTPHGNREAIPIGYLTAAHDMSPNVNLNGSATLAVQARCKTKDFVMVRLHAPENTLGCLSGIVSCYNIIFKRHI